MSQKKYKSRLESDFKKTFKSAHGKHVLMHLYECLYADRTTFTEGAQPEQMFINEGMRRAWLIINQHLKETDHDLRDQYQEHFNERMIEEMNE